MWVGKASSDSIEYFFECPVDKCKRANREENSILKGRKLKDEESLWKDHSVERDWNNRFAVEQRWLGQEGPGVNEEKACFRQGHQTDVENPR